MKILVLDAANKNTLAIVRYLGADKSLHLEVSGYNNLSPAFYSRFVKKKIIMRDPRKNKQAFWEDLKRQLERTKYDLVIPVGHATYDVCTAHAEELNRLSRFYSPSPGSFKVASEKKETYALASQLGIPVPVNIPYSSVESLDPGKLQYPLAIKAPVEMGKNVVDYCYSADELMAKIAKVMHQYDHAAHGLPVIQQYIKGDGYGYFAYCEEGKVIRYFMHHRIREYPVTGGASVCAESFYDETLKAYGEKLLGALKWNGVAMVEFKKDEAQGKYYLLEINPKFWGSLELALAAGVNFPKFLVDRVRGESISSQTKYRNIRFQWIINGELFHFFSRPGSFFAIVRDLFRSKKDTWWSDPLPNMVQFVLVFVHYFKKLKA